MALLLWWQPVGWRGKQQPRWLSPSEEGPASSPPLHPDLDPPGSETGVSLENPRGLPGWDVTLCIRRSEDIIILPLRIYLSSADAHIYVVHVAVLKGAATRRHQRQEFSNSSHSGCRCNYSITMFCLSDLFTRQYGEYAKYWRLIFSQWHVHYVCFSKNIALKQH